MIIYPMIFTGGDGYFRTNFDLILNDSKDY